MRCLGENEPRIASGGRAQAQEAHCDHKYKHSPAALVESPSDIGGLWLQLL